MQIWVTHALITVGTLIVMEPLVALTHRYVMHGFGWGWHRDHHLPGHRRFERNDWYAVLGAIISITLFALAGHANHWLFWVALGITIYGALYTLVHDGLVHRRWPMPRRPLRGYLKRLVEAHHLHHAVQGREGTVSYGFLYAHSADHLRRQLRERKALRAAESETAERHG